MNNLFRLKECANLYMSNLQRVQPYAVLEIVGPNNSIRYIYCRNIHITNKLLNQLNLL